jgi:hypothetical protein
MIAGVAGPRQGVDRRQYVEKARHDGHWHGAGINSSRISRLSILYVVASAVSQTASTVPHPKSNNEPRRAQFVPNTACNCGHSPLFVVSFSFADKETA